MHVAIWQASIVVVFPYYNMDKGGMVSHGLVTMWQLTKIPNPIWYPGTGTQVQCCVAIVYPQSFIRNLTSWTRTHTRTRAHGTHTHGPVPVPIPISMVSYPYPYPYPWLRHMSYPYPYPYPWSRTRTRTHTHGLEPVPVPIPMASYPYPYPYPWSVPTLQVCYLLKIAVI